MPNMMAHTNTGVGDRIALFDEMLSSVPKGTRRVYVEALLQQQQPLALTLRGSSQRHHNASSDPPLPFATVVPQSTGGPYRSSEHKVDRQLSDAMLRKQREAERLALRSALKHSAGWGYLR